RRDGEAAARGPRDPRTAKDRCAVAGDDDVPTTAGDVLIHLELGLDQAVVELRLQLPDRCSVALPLSDYARARLGRCERRHRNDDRNESDEYGQRTHEDPP